MDTIVPEKKCSKCGGVKPITEFYKHKGRAQGVDGTCKACQTPYSPKYYQEHREEARAYSAKRYAEHKEEIKADRAARPEECGEERRRWRLKRLYSLTVAEYDAMLAKQDGACAICGKPPNGQRLSVDHDHTTREARGLLCRDCNFGIGYFRDAPILLLCAAEYMVKKV